MKMRPLLLVFVALLIASCDQSSQVRKIENPFPNASEIRLFVQVDYDKNSGEPILKNATGVALSAADRAQFEDTLKIVPIPDEMTACFVPHHFFRYFDRSGKQVGEVAVCFCCAGARASGSDRLEGRADEMLSADFQALEKVILELGEPTQVLCD
jgi:hypothetical protein